MKSEPILGTAFAAATLVLLASGPAAGESTPNPLAPPDPATVSIPELSFTQTPADVRHYDTYFYFYKASVSYADAFADLDECRLYSMTGKIGATPPTFVPLGGKPILEKQQFVYSDYGVVGALIEGFFAEQAEEEFATTSNNRCMAYKGYSRYGTSRAIWKQLNADNDRERLARMARVASGPQPQTGKIDP